MQAVGKKNRTSLHSLYDFVLMTRGILCIGTGGPTYKRTRGLLCFGISAQKLDGFKILKALTLDFNSVVCKIEVKKHLSLINKPIKRFSLVAIPDVLIE